MRTSKRLVLLVLSSTAFACSTVVTTVPAPCGEGTELVEGACVPSDAGAAPDTSPGSDAVSLDGSNDGAVGDEGSRDGESDSMSLADSLMDSAEAGDDSSSTPDAAKDGAGSGDPCPTTAPTIDCSGECGLATYPCSSVSCFKPSLSTTTEEPHLLITNPAKLPMIIRTPDLPGVDPLCQPRCGAGNTTYGIAFRLHLDPAPVEGIRIKVAPPWKIYRYWPYTPHCAAVAAGPDKGNCFVEVTGSYSYLVATTDPNAPARNITVENLAPGSLHCE